ncbi:MAG: hypothetical protein LBR44_06985 [Clostridiales Family XIII bacterium]|nr:hypothetical protein [Clostridiales Family XIII bacterium]
MNIIVLGNGFDLAHGLPTRYTDFLKYCRDYGGKSKSISYDSIIESEFSKSIRDNVWLDYFISITLDLDGEKTWIDFETEILGVVQAMCPIGGITHDKLKYSKHTLFADFYTFAEGYRVSPMYDALRKFTRAFEIYCFSIIEKKRGIKKRYQLNKLLLCPRGTEDAVQETYIVSFNYTHTFNRFYDLEEKGSRVNYSYVYPHGQADEEVAFEPASPDLVTSGLVLGTESFNREEGEYNIPPEFNVFQKHNQQHRYSTLADFQYLLQQLRRTAETSEPVNIFVIGHSLDKSDHAKLKHIFSENRSAKITIFYHDQDSFQKYIDNITAILGESDVAVRVRFCHQNNPTNGLLLPYRIFEDGRFSCDIIDSDEDQIGELMFDYFLSSGIPSSLDEISTHSSIESVVVETIDNVELFEDGLISVKGTGYVEAKLEYGSMSDFRHGDGSVMSESFPLEFALELKEALTSGETVGGEYIIDDIDYRIDTSSWYE